MKSATFHTASAVVIAILLATFAALVGYTAWLDLSREPTTGTDHFTIRTPELEIRVVGDRALMDEWTPEVMMRVEAVDPALIRPGIGLWVKPTQSDPILIGHVVDVLHHPPFHPPTTEATPL